MLVIDAEKLNKACDAMLVACTTARSESGLLVIPQLPTDAHRIRAIVLGAIVGLVGTAARPSDEVPVGFV